MALVIWAVTAEEPSDGQYPIERNIGYYQTEETALAVLERLKRENDFSRRVWHDYEVHEAYLLGKAGLSRYGIQTEKHREVQEEAARLSNLTDERRTNALLGPWAKEIIAIHVHD